jgi:aspartate/methionine/tyrosine aminotransferase
MHISRRAEKITPFYVMELLEKAKAMEAKGESIVHMEVGEPDFSTPSSIKERAIEAIRDNRSFYTHSLGIPELREAISAYYRKTEGLEVSPDRIIVTNGTSGAFLLLFAVLLEKGGRLGIADPGYPCYRNFGHLFDAHITALPVTEGTGFEITEEHLRQLRRPLDLLVLANPSNPTGAVYGMDAMVNLHALLSGRKTLLVVDEIYSALAYGRKAPSALAVSPDIMVINGFSKAFAMTGWRLGWMAVPQSLVRPIQKIAQNVYISPPAISQYAALSAFDSEEELAVMRDTYRERRDFLLPRLRGLGFTVPLDPEGAFYIYAGIEKWGLDSMDFTERALAEAKVAITPGYDFGLFRAASHVRFTYTAHLEMLKEGCDRLEAWLRTV